MTALVVTLGKGGAVHEAEARAKASAWGLPFVERPRRGGVGALLASGARACLVRRATGWVLRDARGTLTFSPGMAALRVRRLDAGQRDDAVVALGELRPGDVVIDGTLGLAADALVCARAVGPGGRVVGFEASLALWALVSEGLAAMGALPGSCAVEGTLGRARDALRRWPTGSADVVVFDPMFETAAHASAAFEALRAHALHDALDEATLREARRVARRWVLVKAAPHGDALRRLGLTSAPGSRYARVRWARVGPLPGA